MMQSRKQKVKELLTRGTKGAISILLCLVITPFLGVSVALVEYARYQEVIELVDELEELTGVSLLADYDQYIHNRFGILATSQQQDFNAVASAYMSSNAGALGNQVTVNNVTAKGGMSLNENEVLKHQLLDVAETTGLAQVLVEDFNIEELMNALQGLDKFNKLTNTIDNMSTVTSNIRTIVEDAEKLKADIESVQNAASKLSSDGNALASKITAFYKKLNERGYEFPDNLTETEFDELASTVLGEYEADITDIYKTANNLVGYVDTIKTKVPSIVSQAKTLKTKISDTVTLAKNLTNNKSEEGVVTEVVGGTLEDVVNQMDSLITSCLDKLINGSLDTVKKAAEDIVKTSFSSLGLGDAPKRYNSILKGEYFGDPPSDLAKEDFKDLISCIPDIWDDKSADSVFQLLKNKFVPQINFNFTEYIKDIGTIVKNAKDVLVDSAQSSVFDTIINLVNIVRKLFELNVFYDDELCALVDLSESSLSPYQEFLKSISDMLTSINSGINGLKSGKFFEVIDAVINLCTSVVGFVNSIIGIITQTFSNMWDLISNFANGNGWNNIAERLLLAGYSVHNFPNRTDKSRELDSDYNGSMSTVRLHLNNQGITGFKYNDIARPYQYANSYSIGTGIDALKNAFTKGVSKGTDKMFKGAEAEYILAGTNSEIMNQTVTFFNLYFLRMLCSLPAVFMDGEVASVAAAANVACWVVYILYALIEPFADCLLLVNDGKVPIVKVSCFMTPSKITDFGDKLVDITLSKEVINTIGGLEKKSKGDSGGKEEKPSLGDDMLEAEYESHLLILTMMNLKVDTMVERIQALVELETAEYYRQRNQKFDMNKTYATLTVTADITFNPFINFGGFVGDDQALQIRKTMTQVVGY